MISKKEHPYSKISNVMYLLKKMWRWDKIFIFMIIPLPFLAVICSIITTYIPKSIIDSIEQNKSIGQIIANIVFIFGILFILNTVENFFHTRASARNYSFSQNFEVEILNKYTTTDFANTDNPEMQNKYRYVIDDAKSGGSAADWLIWAIYVLVLQLLGIFSYSAIITTLSPIVLLIIILSSLVIYLLGNRQVKYIDKNKELWTELDRKNWYIASKSEQFDYAKDIKIYNMFAWITNMFKNIQGEHFKWNKKVNFRNFIIKTVTAFLTLARDGTAYFILIYMFLDKKVTLGDFAFYFGAIVGFSTWLDGIGGQLNSVASQSISIGYYREYLSIKDVYNHGAGCELPKGEELPLEIEFRNVSYKYSGAENYTIKNVSFKINKGEKLAIIGKNGAGKTTMVKLMCGYYYPTEGEILVNGKNLAEYNIDQYYTLFSAVFQDIYLMPVTIAQFIASDDVNIDHEKIREAIAKAELEAKIDSLPAKADTKLMKNVYDDATDLSGGEKQKLMLARALYKDAPCIILDEPTAALDPIAENNLYQQYSRLTKKKTSLYISHRLASTRFCDRILLIEDGRIAEQGTHDELMKKKCQYSYMYDLQSHYYKDDAEQEGEDERNEENAQ